MEEEEEGSLDALLKGGEREREGRGGPIYKLGEGVVEADLEEEGGGGAGGWREERAKREKRERDAQEEVEDQQALEEAFLRAAQNPELTRGAGIYMYMYI